MFLKYKSFLFVLIFLIALFFRIYKLTDTVTFYEDQAYNSLQIRNMLETNLLDFSKSATNFLKGPITHLKGFKLGPAY